MQTENVGHRSNGSVVTRVLDQESIWSPTDRDVITTPTHGEIETISEKLAYRKFIKDSEIETREVFERENIENIGTRLETTQLDNQITQSVDSSKRSEKHEPEVNLDSDPPSSDSSDSSSSDPAPKKKKSKKKKKCRKHRKDDSSDPSLSDDSDSSDDSHYRRKRRKDRKHQKKYPIRLCATLTSKLLTTAYKLNIIRFKWMRIHSSVRFILSPLLTHLI